MSIFSKQGNRTEPSTTSIVGQLALPGVAAATALSFGNIDAAFLLAVGGVVVMGTKVALSDEECAPLDIPFLGWTGSAICSIFSGAATLTAAAILQAAAPQAAHNIGLFPVVPVQKYTIGK